MMKTIKTALSLFITLCLLLSFGAVTAFAEDGGTAIPDPVPAGATVEVNPVRNTISENNGTIGTESNFNNTGNYGTVEVNGTSGTIIRNDSAGTVETNNGTVQYSYGTVGCVDESGNPVEGTGNNGTILINRDGTVTSNNADGYINTNAGLLIENKEGATVNNNTFGESQANPGIIINNAGTVEYNTYGTIKTNTGTVEQNTPYGTVENNYGEVISYGHGTVTNNYGDVTNYGEATVMNNYGGNVTNYGSGSVTHDFYGVKVETEAADHSSDDCAYQGNGYYLEKDEFGTAEGTVTIRVTPKEDYILDTPTVDKADNTDELSVSGDNTGWTVSFKNLLGNILLTITGRKNEPQPEPQPEPDPKPVSRPETKTEPVYRAVVSFDLDGGTLNGQSGSITFRYYFGQTIRMPEAPVKDGFTFAGWETEVKGEKVVLQPGEGFTVTGAASFTALWTEA